MRAVIHWTEDVRDCVKRIDGDTDLTAKKSSMVIELKQALAVIEKILPTKKARDLPSASEIAEVEMRSQSSALHIESD